MHRPFIRLVAFAMCAMALNACGDGGSSPSRPAAGYDLQAGFIDLVNKGETANVTLSGTALVNGNSVPFNGTGTLTLAPAVAATFNNAAALSQSESITGTVTAAGQSAPYTSAAANYYAPSTGAVLGQSTLQEYDVVQSPYTLPTSVVGGASGILGTVSRYTDASLGVSLGTATVSYLVSVAVNAGDPVAVQFTNKIYDTQNTLIETDVTTYSLTSTSILSFTSATAQTASGSLTVTAN